MLVQSDFLSVSADLVESAGMETIEELIRDTVGKAVREVLRSEVQALATAPTPPPSSSDLMTISEAASFARVHPATIRQWIKAGRLKASRAGRVWRIQRAELVARLQPPMASALPDSRDIAEKILGRRLLHR